MNPSTTRIPQRFLVVAFMAGLATPVLAAVGLWQGLDVRLDDPDSLSNFLFYSVAVFAFEQPDDLGSPLPLSFALARVGVVVFSLSTAIGVFLEISRPVRHFLLRLGDWARMLVGQRPTILLGLGWIGGPIAAELKHAGRAVYAITPQPGTPLAVELRRFGVIVIGGDASDPRTRREVPLHRAREVFVATGDDATNVEMVGEVLEASRRWRRDTPLVCYVHIEDPKFAETLGWQQIWSYSSDQLRLVPFSYPELAARDLFFGPKGLVADPVLCPTGRDAFHLVIIGFGFMGQTVARHVARFGHFASLSRPRITVMAPDAAEFLSFLERYPAFSPHGLDLLDPALREAGGDDWDRPAGRPAAHRHRIDDAAVAEGAVEYVVNAEFVQLSADLAAESLSQAILDRAEPPGEGARVHMAVVVCLEEDRASFEAALRIQYALATAIADRGGPPSGLHIPVYVHLPEQGLATVLHRTDANVLDQQDDKSWLSDQHRSRDQVIPVRVFGIREQIAGYQQVTTQDLRRQAGHSRELYQLLRPIRARSEHLDFTGSNLDAVLHAQVKLAALGIALVSRDKVPSGARLVLEPLFGRDVDKKLGRRSNRGAVPRAELAEREPEVRARLVLHHRVSGEAGAGPDIVVSTLDEVTAMMAAELEQHGIDPDVPARMEHNRWMGERLLKGWRYGPRNDLTRQRASMKVWRLLGPDDRRYDAISLPRFIADAHEAGLVAYWKRG